MNNIPASQHKDWRDGVPPFADEDPVEDDEEEDEEPEFENASYYYASKAPRAGKRPRTRAPVADPELDGELDLRKVFKGIPPNLQTSVCRAYGSYLTALKKCQAAKKDFLAGKVVEDEADE